MSALTLPALTAEERVHSERLRQRVDAEITAQGGWIGFSRYMQMALYEPGLGYYSAGASKFGRDGDFVTAPEISPLFSRCLARQCAEILNLSSASDILEFGAGAGTMAADMLLELKALECLPSHYYIMEVSADLRERQRTTVLQRAPELIDRVHWLDALPENFSGVIVANEVLDALPVDRFRIRGAGVNAVGVTATFGNLEWSETAGEPKLATAVRAIEQELELPFADGYCSEINLQLTPWLRGLAASMSRGVMLFIDYGLPRRQYYRPDREEGTLLCHFRHRFHSDPFINLGLQDIGAWVDFTAVAEAAVECGLEINGYTTQAHFLIGNGIDRLLADPGEDLPARVQVARQAMMLTLPAEMGERFKVIALAKNFSNALQGFSVRDLTHGL